MAGEPKRKVAQAECFECHEIWPKNEMTQTFAVSSTRSSISMRGSMSASTTKSRVWRCPNCQRKIDEVWEKRSEVAAGILLVVMKMAAVLGLLYATKVYVFPNVDSSVLKHVGAVLFRHHI
jgi:hypothetical protein